MRSFSNIGGVFRKLHCTLSYGATNILYRLPEARTSVPNILDCALSKAFRVTSRIMIFLLFVAREFQLEQTLFQVYESGVAALIAKSSEL